MISALDSSVILDVLTADPRFADTSEALLRKAAAEGKLVIGECVLAEITPAFKDEKMLEEFLADWQIEFVPSSRASSILAGRNFARYLSRGGRAGRVVADFLIGAPAAFYADRLVARGRGYLRDYFSKLAILLLRQSASSRHLMGCNNVNEVRIALSVSAEPRLVALEDVTRRDV
jgi:predicted nucleic acid-binding protein